jgi:hypothetical protein
MMMQIAYFVLTLVALGVLFIVTHVRMSALEHEVRLLWRQRQLDLESRHHD